MAKVVVTGASGHIGYHVARLLLEQKHELHLLVRSRNAHIAELENAGAAVHTVNLFHPTSFAEVLSNTDAIFHLASENTTDTSDEQRVLDNTLGLTRKVLDTAIEKKVQTIMYTSSVVVLGRSHDPNKLLDENARVKHPESPYVKGKLLSEKYCDELAGKADIRRLYPSWVVGGGDLKGTPPHKLIGGFVQKGQGFYFKGGISVAAVEEVAKAHVNAWLKGKSGGKYVLAGDNIHFKDFYSLLANHSGRKAPGMKLPKWFLWCAAVGLKMVFGKKSPADPKYISSVVGNYSWYDSQKAVAELGYAIPKADELLKEAVKDARQRATGLHLLSAKNFPGLQRKKYNDDDVLLITGFPGWLGNRMVDIFMNGDRFGHNAIERKVRLLVQPHFNGLVNLPPNFEVVYGDITDKKSLEPALKGVKCVYHLAGVIYPKKMKAFDAVNAAGTKNLVDVCLAAGVPRILNMGTDSICGYGREKRVFDEYTPPRPYKNYGRTKYEAERYILDKTKEGKINGTSLRGFWFFGPFMPERNRGFFEMFKWKKQVVFGNGKNYRSISHVDNTVEAFIKAEASAATKGKWYWVGDKNATLTVDQIYSNIADGLGLKYNPLYVPRFVCEMLSWGDTFLGWFGILNPTIHAAGKFHKDIAGDISAAQRDFGYTAAVGFDEIKKELKELL